MYRERGSCRARWAIRSTPVVVSRPPQGVVGVAIERSPVCALYAQRALPHVLARTGASDFLWVIGLPPGVPVVPPTPSLGGTHRTSRVPGSALVTCRRHRPRWARG